MLEDQILQDIQRTMKLREKEFFAAERKSPEAEQLARELTELSQRKFEREQELYFALEVSEPLELAGLSKEELQDLAELTRRQFMATSSIRTLKTDAEEAIRVKRWTALRENMDELQIALDNIRREEYNPGPDEAPVFEPAGYSATAGFVKSQPGNNEFYLEQFRDDPWYPIIRDTHEQLEHIAPGYNISQIKEKFGGLRYYIDLPEVLSDEDREAAYAIVRDAEDRVDRYEAERRQAENEGEDR